jgi:hypothetical protein
MDFMYGGEDSDSGNEAMFGAKRGSMPNLGKAKDMKGSTLARAGQLS